MDGLWQTIIGGLAVAAITGLSIIAYRHPAAYARIYRPLVCMLVGAWVVWFIYGIGFDSGFGNAVLTTMKLNSGSLIKTPSRDLPSFWLYMVPAIVYAYLSFLKLLPHLLRDEAPNPEKTKDDA
jgi:amino acid transporter